MAAPVIRQTTAFFAPGTAIANGTATLGAWPSNTLSGSRIVTFFGVNAQGQNGIAASCAVGTATASGTAITRQASGNDQVTLSTFEVRNAAGTAAAPKVVLSGVGTAGVYVWGVALEVTGDDNTRDYDITPTLTTGAGTAFTVGPTGTSDQGDILWLSAVAIPNIQSIALATGSGWSVVSTGGSGGSGNSAKATGIATQISRSAAGAVQVSYTIPNGNTRQYAAAIIAIPATTTGGSGTGGGYGGSPQSFPLGPPDMTGATTLNDPNPNAHWSPTLTNGVDYILNMPAQRSAGVTVTGGRNIYVPKLLIRMTASVQGAMFAFGGGNSGRIIHVEQCHLDPNGFQCDAFKTQSPASSTVLQLKVVRIEEMIGDTNTGSVHADLIQTSGGLGDCWIEDFTGGTDFNGLNFQQEGKLNASYTPVTIHSIALSAGTITVTTASAHGLSTDQYFQINDNVNNSQPFSGGFKIATAPSGTVVTAQFGDSTPSNYTDSGSHTYNLQQFTFPYTVGSIHLNRVNVTGYTNPTGSPSHANMAIRFGARTAQNSGFNSGHPNDDETPVDNLAWAGTFDVPNDQTFFAQPPPTVSLGSFMAPDSGTATYSVVRPVSHAAAGGTPAYVAWPNWPAVTSSTRCYQGTATTGDYVIISGGLPVPTAAGTATPGTAPAPVNVTAPVVTPPAPATNSVIGVASIGTWNNTDASTVWTVNFQNSLGGTAAYSTVQSTSSLTAAQAGTVTLGTAPLVGYTYRLQVIANNGQPGTAVSSASSVVVDNQSVTMVLEIE